MWTLKNNIVIGKKRPVFLIAEAGVNHNGNIESAHELIDAAAAAGADGIKFQTFITEELVSSDTPLAGHHIANVKSEESHFELLKKLELPFDAFPDLKTHCEQKGMVFISTPYDILSANYLIDLQIELIKIASSEMMNLPLLDVIRKSRIPVLISSGMSSWEEILESVNFMNEFHENICVLKCTSNYPASPESTNLLGISKLEKIFPTLLTGFSDHSEGLEISLASIVLGVSVIERHFTLDREQWGPDHRASMTPDEFKEFVGAARKVEAALGAKDWQIQAEEITQRKTMKKGVFARHDIEAGDKVGVENVKFQRPEGQLSPKDFYHNWMGKVIRRHVPAGAPITEDDFLS